ncbi:hypothetical protein LCGC14_3098640, partial [marine sediment metagenome]
GLITGLTSDNYQSVKVTYIPQFSHGFFSFANMVIEEALALGGSVWTVANRAALVQFVSEPSSAITLAPQGHENAPDSGNVRVDMNSSGDTKITAHADEAAALVITYLKFAGIPTTARARAFIDRVANGRAITTYETSSEVIRWGEDIGFGREYLVIPGLGNAAIVALTTDDIELMNSGPGDVQAAGMMRLNIGKNMWETSESTAIDQINTYGLELTPDLLGGAIELFPNIDAPEDQTLWVMTYGW